MVKAYIDYFRQLSILHADIGHKAVAETLNGNPSECRFGRFWNMDLYVAKTPSGIVTDKPALHLQLFDMEIDDSTGYYDMKGLFDGGFIISEKAILNNTASEEDALHRTFEITLDFHKHIKEKSVSNCGLYVFDFANVKCVQVGPIWDNRYGWYTTFQTMQKLNLEDRPNKFSNISNNNG